MKRKMILGFVFLFSITILLTILHAEIMPKIEELSIKKEIEKANYCKEDLDCVNAGSKCPFGCWNYVNKNEVERISNLINLYDSKCVYGCVLCEKAICEDNKCVSVCD